MDTVEMGPYLAELASSLVANQAPNGECRIVTSLAGLVLDTARAVSVGLVVNELFTNAIKYGCRPGVPAEIRLELTDSGGDIAPAVDALPLTGRKGAGYREPPRGSFRHFPRRWRRRQKTLSWKRRGTVPRRIPSLVFLSLFNHFPFFSTVPPCSRCLRGSSWTGPRGEP